jgi:hypothetical protein
MVYFIASYWQVYVASKGRMVHRYTKLSTSVLFNIVSVIFLPLLLFQLFIYHYFILCFMGKSFFSYTYIFLFIYFILDLHSSISDQFLHQRDVLQNYIL